MKKILFGLLSVLLISLSACKEKGPELKLPELGEMTASQDQIGIGQLVSFSVVETAPASGTVLRRQAVWKINGNQVLEDNTVYQDGQYQCYYVPEVPGILNVELHIYCVFSGAPEGESMKEATVSQEFQAVPCDARTSFWGESMDESRQRQTGLASIGSGEELYGAGLPSLKGYRSVIKSVNLRYSYTAGGLVRIDETFIQSPDQGGSYPYRAVSKSYATGVASLAFEYPSTIRMTVHHSDDVTPAQFEAASKFVEDYRSLSDEQWNILGEAMVKDNVWIVTACNTETTSVEFQTVGNKRDNNVTVSLKYTKK